MLPEGRHLHMVVDEAEGVAFFEQESSFQYPAPVGLALFLPAFIAYRLGRVWLASVFATSALISFIYDVVEARGTVVPAPWASAGLRQTLRLLDGGSVYFCLLQLGFVVIGPEDVLSEISKLDADLLVARVFPSIAMILFLSTRSSWPDFHWQSMILLDVLWLLGFTVFWFQPARRGMASEVLLRSHYWLRLWKQALLPTAVLSIFLAALQATLVSQATPSACRTVFALVAARVISWGHGQGEKLRESQRLQELQGLSPNWNPMVARQLLGAPGLLGSLTVFASLVTDLFTSSQPWPLLSRPVHTRPGGYLVVLGALPSLLAMTAALWLVSSAVNGTSIFDEEISFPKELACLSGYVSIALGFFTLLLQCLELPKLQAISLVFCLCTMVLAVLGSAVGSISDGVFRSRCLCASTMCSVLILSSFMVMLVLDQQLIPNHYQLPRHWLALTEYLSVAAYLLWPLVWAREVHSSWQLHKAWPSSSPIQMA